MKGKVSCLKASFRKIGMLSKELHIITKKKAQHKSVINSTFPLDDFLGNIQYCGYLGPFLQTNHFYL